VSLAQRVSAEDGVEEVPGFREFGVLAFTTTRQAGSFGTAGDEPVGQVMARWSALRVRLGASGQRFATASQVHGARVLVHEPAWSGWLRAGEADGHVAPRAAMGLAVTVADCVPVFLAHPAGGIGVLHSGWRGTVARIVEQGIAVFREHGQSAEELRVHLGPAICGNCYEVSPEVHHALTGRATSAPAPVDLRAIIADHARAAGVRHLTVSPWCTRCHQERFFSHRGGDAGRQLGVIAHAPGSGMRGA
jgi:YfiH family protein